jgi:hypothetical protein
VNDRIAGVLLFLPVPIVLFLFTRAPLGVATSLVLGVVVMLTHRLYARPFALARAERRCLWCGGPAAAGPLLDVEDPLGATRWRACTDAHGDHLRRFLQWAARHRALLQIGILGTLALFLAATALIAAGRGGPLRYADAVNAFRLLIAAAVLPLGFLSVRSPATGAPLRAPFPVHIQALIGTGAVRWLFRLVGVAWLLLALTYFAARA